MWLSLRKEVLSWKLLRLFCTNDPVIICCLEISSAHNVVRLSGHSCVLLHIELSCKGLPLFFRSYASYRKKAFYLFGRRNPHSNLGHRALGDVQVFSCCCLCWMSDLIRGIWHNDATSIVLRNTVSRKKTKLNKIRTPIPQGGPKKVHSEMALGYWLV